MSGAGLNLTLKVWRQNSSQDKGEMETYEVKDISPDSSFLEMMDILNEQLIRVLWMGLRPNKISKHCWKE